MTLEELIAVLRTDLGDPNGELADDASLERAVRRALPLVCRDLDVSHRIVDGVFQPEPDDLFKELLLLRAQAFACSMLRAMTARNFSFKSGDKEVDKTRQADWWAKQEKDLLAEYRGRIDAVKPGDPTVAVTPMIYELDTEPCDCD